MEFLFDVNACCGFDRLGRVDASLEAFWDLSKRVEVQKACICSLKGAFYDYSEGNEETLRICEGREELFPVATLDPRRCWQGEKEVKRLWQRGFRLLRLFPELQDWPYRYKPFMKILTGLVERPLLLLLPIRDLGSLTELSHLIPPGAPFPVVLLGVGYRLLSEALSVLAERERFYLETSRLCTPDAYELFSQELGSQRLLFGSGFPFTNPGAPAFALRQALISTENKERISHANLEGLLAKL